jgi:glycine/D-amino acid oxidase-like deaminating enzyme
MATVIIGAGIIGTSTAYYLSESSTPASDIHLIEPSPQLFASASGYAAGFLARDWFPPSLSSLGALSFDLHKELAEANNGQEKWGYSSSTSSSLEETIGERGEDWLSEGVSRVRAANTSGSVNGDGPAWLAHHGKLDIISTGDTTAQVYVRRLYMILEHCPSKSHLLLPRRNLMP